MPKQKLSCNVSHASEFLSEPWTMLLLREFMIFGGTRRFEQLHNALGISRNVLTKRLRRLLELGLIKKSPIFESSRRMEYKMRRKAWELSPVMLALHLWADRWSDDNHVTEIDFLDIPTYAKKMPVYDTNILNYIGHVGDCLVEQKETELLEISNRL